MWTLKDTGKPHPTGRKTLPKATGKDLENTQSSLKLSATEWSFGFLLSFPHLLHGDHHMAFPCRCHGHEPPQARLQSTGRQILSNSLTSFLKGEWVALGARVP